MFATHERSLRRRIVNETIARRPLFAASCAGLFLFGIVLALLGTLCGLPEMRLRLGINMAQQGDLFLLLYFGVFIATALAGPLIDRLGNKPVLAVSALLVTAALGGFAAWQSFRLAAASALLLGLGGGGLNTAANTLVSDLYSEDRGAMLNVLGVFYGIGALAIPLLAAGLEKLLSIPQLLAAAAGLAALILLTFLALRFPPGSEAKNFSTGELAQVVKYPGVLLLAFTLFFQSGNEASIGGWTSSYIGALGESGRTATWVLAGYWAALIAGRLLAAHLLKFTGKAQLVFASGVGSVIGCAVLLLARTLVGMTAGVVILGLSFSAIYPTTLAIAGDRYKRFAGSVFALLFAIGILGGMSFPWAIGQIGNSLGIRPAMMVPLGSTAMICVLAAMVRARERKE